MRRVVTAPVRGVKCDLFKLNDPTGANPFSLILVETNSIVEAMLHNVDVLTDHERLA